MRAVVQQHAPAVPVKRLPVVAAAVVAHVALDQIELAELAGVENCADRPGFAVQAVRLVGHQPAPGPAGGLKHRLGFGQGHGQRFVAENVAIRLHRRDGLLRMKESRRSDHHQIGTLFVQHGFEIGI